MYITWSMDQILLCWHVTRNKEFIIGSLIQETFKVNNFLCACSYSYPTKIKLMKYFQQCIIKDLQSNSLIDFRFILEMHSPLSYMNTTLFVRQVARNHTPDDFVSLLLLSYKPRQSWSTAYRQGFFKSVWVEGHFSLLFSIQFM